MHYFEGCRNKPYRCSAEIWTVGWGHAMYAEQLRLPNVRKEGKDTPMIRKEMPLKPEDNRVWTKEEIEKLFEDDVGPTERGVLRLAPALSGRQGAFDACVSFAFNAGVGAFQRSSIRMKIMKRPNLHVRLLLLCHDDNLHTVLPIVTDAVGWNDPK